MEFKILENLERRNKFMHLANEMYYSEYYKNQGYTVINNYNKKHIPPIKGKGKEPKEYKKSLEENTKAYKRCLYYMIKEISETSNTSIKDIYIWCFNDVCKHFNVSISQREGCTYIEKLTYDELEYICLRLFNKYKKYVFKRKKSELITMTQF